MDANAREISVLFKDSFANFILAEMNLILPLVQDIHQVIIRHSTKQCVGGLAKKINCQG